MTGGGDGGLSMEMKKLIIAAVCLGAALGIAASAGSAGGASLPAASAPQRMDWRAQLPRPIFDEKPELVEFYDKAWEIAHTHVDNLPGIPVPRYMDEGHRSDLGHVFYGPFLQVRTTRIPRY